MHAWKASNILGYVLWGWILVGWVGAGVSQADEPPTRGVKDLTNQELSSELLVESLRPQGIQRPKGARSLVPPNCAKFHRQKSRGIRPKPVSEQIAITVEFASDSAELTPEAKGALDALGKALVDPDLEGCCFQVEGHTDDQNTDAYNKALSERRAQSVVDYLSEHFDIVPDQLLLWGRGESEPLADNATAEGRQKNRRVQVATLGYQTSEGGP